MLHRHLHLNTLIVRHMLPEWRSDDATDLRRSSACRLPTSARGPSASTASRCAPTASRCAPASWRRSSRGATHHCKHSWTDDGSGSPEFAFVPALERAAVACHRESGTAYGWGWMHASVLKDVPAFGSKGLRVMFRWGETQCGHTTLACRMPAMRLSFVFNTTAPFNALCRYGESRCADEKTHYKPSILETIGGFVRAILAPMHKAASLHSTRARFWDPTLNAALCELPPECVHYASHYGGLRMHVDAFACI